MHFRLLDLDGICSKEHLWLECLTDGYLLTRADTHIRQQPTAAGCWRIQKHHFAAVQSETEAFESINISAAGRKPALRITIANRNTISWMNDSVYLLPFCPTDML